MANSDKNIRIQPNRNSTLFPKITFTGQSNNPITLNVLDDNSISFEGSSGQLFAINNNLSSGYIFSVNDISGLPSFRINADGTVGIAEYYGNVGIGVTNPLYKFHARGDSYFSSIGNTALLLVSGAGGTIIASNSVNITLTDPARKGLVITAATSQSDNLLEWYANAVGVGGYGLAGTIRPTGQLHLGSPGIIMSNGGSALLALQGRGSSEGLAIRGYNSNLNNPLFEVQGNPGNQLFGIYGDGGVNAPRINVYNTTGSTTTSSGALIVSGGVGIGGSVHIGRQLTVTETTRLNSSIFNNPPTSSIGGSLISSGAIWGSYWTGYQVENGYLIYGRQVSGASIIIAEPLTGTQVGGTVNVFAEALKHFKWGNDKYVVLASTGNSVLYSTSPVGAGSSWYYATLPTSASWQKLEYGNNRFIAIATGSTSAYSLDGINWTLSTLPGSYTWSDIKHGNGVFVAGAGNTVAYTYDGIEWTIASNNVNSTFITFGNGLFFANSSSNTASYSSDGITWTNTTLPSDTHRGTVYGNGVFYNIGASSSNYISSDLINWTAIPGGVGTLSVPNAPWYVNNTFNQNQYAGSSGSISSGPLGTLDFSPRFTGDLNNVRIGAVTPGSAEFTSLAAVGPVRFVSNIASTNYKSGSVVITGGVGIGGTLNVNNIGIGYTGIPYNPSIAFIGTTGDPIRLSVLANNTLSFEGSSGQLFSINNNLSSGWIFSVNDISGIPLFRANANANIAMAEYAGNVGIGLSNAIFKLQVAGSASIGDTLFLNRLKVNSKITFEPGTGTSAVSGWTGIGLTSISKMIYGGGRFVGVGGSYVAYSTDGVNFTYTTIPGSTSSANYGDIKYGNGIFVAVNVQNVNFTAYSYDGASWGTTSIGSGQIRNVGFGNGRFLAPADVGNVVYSSVDGRNWAAIAYLSGYGNEILFANGYFIAVKSGFIVYSKDGVSWKQANLPGSVGINSVTYGKGLYLAADYNSAQYFTSPDLITWTQRSIDNKVWTGASYVNGVFYLIPNNNNFLHHSLDGINWSSTNFGTPIFGTNKFFTANDRLYFLSGSTLWSTDATTGTLMAKPFYNGELENTRIGAVNPDSATFTHLTALNDVSFTSSTQSTSFDNGALTVTGGVGIGGTLNVGSAQVLNNFNHTPSTGSTGGIAWTSVSYPTIPGLSANGFDNCVIYGGDKFVGIAGTNVYYSYDSYNWFYSPIASSTNPRAITYGNGVYIAINNNGSVAHYSYNGISWSTSTLPNSTVNGDKACFGNGKFVYNDQSGNVGISTNGINWTLKLVLSGGAYPYGVDYANGWYFARWQNNYFRSADLNTWTRFTLPADSSRSKILFSKNKYYAPNNDASNYFVSDDGFNWTTQAVTSGYWINMYDYFGTLYLIRSSANAVSYSEDGINWATASLGGTNNTNATGLVYGNGRFVYVGSNPNLIFSGNAPNGVSHISTPRTSEIDNVRIGANSPASAQFTGLNANGSVNFTSTSDSNSLYNGALTVAGGVGIAGTTNLNTLRVNQDLVFTPTTGTTALAGGLLTATLPAIPGSPGNIRIRAVTFGNGRFVGGASTSIIWSDDAINWNRVNTPFTTGTAIQAIAYGNGTWIASTSTSTELIYSLNNGATWSLATIPYANVTGAVYGNGIFFISSNSYSGISTNGINWTTYTPAYYPHSFINGYFYSNTHRSADGINWQVLNIPVSNAKISYGNGLYFAAEYNSANYYISYDGVNFSTTTIGNHVHVNSAYYNGVYYLLTQHNDQILKYSTDGFNYSFIVYPNGSTNYAIAAGNNKIVLFNTLYTDITNYIYYAEASFGKANIQPFREGTIDNVTIGSRIPQAGTFNNVSVLKNLNVNSSFPSVSSNTGAFTVLGGAGVGQTLNVGGSVNVSNSLNLVNTTTGIATTWTRSFVGTGATITYLAYANNLYVGVGYSSLTSTDAVNWTTRTLPHNLSSVAFGNGIWSGLLSGSALGATSTNGTSWTSYAMTNSRAWRNIVYGNGIFVTLAGSSNIAAYSLNGYNWTEVTMPTSQVWQVVVFGGGYFAAIANASATAVYSIDGINWNITFLPSASGWNSITYGNGYFYVTASSGGGVYSRDLINWTGYAHTINGTAYAAYNNGTFVVTDVFGGTRTNIITGDFTSRTQIDLPGPQSPTTVVAGDRIFIAGLGQTFYTFPIPNNSISVYPNTTGELNNVEIGSVKPASGAFSNIFSQGLVAIGATTRSTSPFTGALTVAGGVGIGGTINIGSDVIINGGRESNSTSTGSLIVRGGVGITGGLYVSPFSSTTKGLVVTSRSSQSGNLFELQNSSLSTITSFNYLGDLNITSSTANTSTTTGSIVTAGGVGIGGSVSIGSTSVSTSTTNGALKVSGGVGIGGNVNVGGSLNFSTSTFGGVSTSITPAMTFIGQANDPITLSVLADNSLSFDGSSGQLFSINNNLSTGYIFSISDISGLPIFRTNADGTVSMGEFGGNVGIGLTNPSYKLQVAGSSSISSVVLDNGLITSGSWAGSLITGLYGGTGFSSYTKGDLIVGVGSTFIKVGTGASHQVLSYSPTSSSGLGWTDLSISSSISTNYGTFYSTTTQPVIAANTITPVTVNNTYEASNVQILGGAGTSSRIQILNAGVYNIQLSLQLNLSSGNQPKEADFWFRINGNDVPWSNTKQSVTGKDYHQIFSLNFVSTFTAGQYFEMMMSSADQFFILEGIGATTGPIRPGTPSVIYTVTKVL